MDLGTDFAREADRAILSKTQGLTDSVNDLLARFMIGEAGRQIQEFLWEDYFDRYLEVSKARISSGDLSSLPVLAHVLDVNLRLLHPWMPFITEAIWQLLREHLDDDENAKALIYARFPQEGDLPRFPNSERRADAFWAMMTGLRQYLDDNSEQIRSLKDKARVSLGSVDESSMRVADSVVPIMERLQRIEISLGNRVSEISGVVSTIGANREFVVGIEGLAEGGRALTRLSKEISHTQRRLKGAEDRLSDENFLRKAPPRCRSADDKHCYRT